MLGYMTMMTKSLETEWTILAIQWGYHCCIVVRVTCPKGSTTNTNSLIILQYSSYSWFLHVFYWNRSGNFTQHVLKKNTGRPPSWAWTRSSLFPSWPFIQSCSPWPCRNSPILPQGSSVPIVPPSFVFRLWQKPMAVVRSGPPPGSVVGRAILVCEEWPHSECARPPPQSLVRIFQMPCCQSWGPDRTSLGPEAFSSKKLALFSVPR